MRPKLADALQVTADQLADYSPKAPPRSPPPIVMTYPNVDTYLGNSNSVHENSAFHLRRVLMGGIL